MVCMLLRLSDCERQSNPTPSCASSLNTITSDYIFKTPVFHGQEITAGEPTFHLLPIFCRLPQRHLCPLRLQPVHFLHAAKTERGVWRRRPQINGSLAGGGLPGRHRCSDNVHRVHRSVQSRPPQPPAPQPRRNTSLGDAARIENGLVTGGGQIGAAGRKPLPAAAARQRRRRLSRLDRKRRTCRQQHGRAGERCRS